MKYTSRLRHISFAIFILSVMMCGNPAAATGNSTSDTSLPGEFHPIGDFNLSAQYFVDHEGLTLLASGTAVSLLARSEDSTARLYFNNQNRLQGWDKLGNDFLGTGVPGLIVASGFWIYGDTQGLVHEINTGQSMLESIIATGAIVGALKEATNRERPNSSDHYSFPSGHTSTVFAAAQVLEDAYGWTIGVPAYALGALTAAGRMSADMHWLSDTVAGATLGITIGHAISRAHFAKFSSQTIDHGNAEPSDFHIVPVFGSGFMQLAVFKDF